MDEDQYGGGNGWGEWRRHVLLQMEANRKSLEGVSKDIAEIKTEVALLKYKSSLWGAVGAGLVVLIYALITYVTK